MKVPKGTFLLLGPDPGIQIQFCDNPIHKFNYLKIFGYRLLIKQAFKNRWLKVIFIKWKCDVNATTYKRDRDAVVTPVIQIAKSFHHAWSQNISCLYLIGRISEKFFVEIRIL